MARAASFIAAAPSSGYRNSRMRGTRFAELSAFVAVAEHRNFTKAAAQLAISPATLSQTIRSFEERLGVALLEDWCGHVSGVFMYYPSRRQMPAPLRALSISCARNPT
jgi:hypothetical protein